MGASSGLHVWQMHTLISLLKRVVSSLVEGSYASTQN